MSDQHFYSTGYLTFQPWHTLAVALMSFPCPVPVLPGAALQSESAGLVVFCGNAGALSHPRQARASGLVKVVVVVMVFMVVVMFMPLHHLCQSTLIQQHTWEVPDLLFLHYRSRRAKRA